MVGPPIVHTHGERWTKFQALPRTRSFFWELASTSRCRQDLVVVSQEAVEVMTFQGYDDMRVRVKERVYDIHLSWRKDKHRSFEEVR